MLKTCSRKQALYLYRKFNRGDISQAMIERLFTEDACVNDIFCGWFIDFYFGL